MDLIMEKTPKIHDELKFYKWHTFWMGIVRDPQQPGRFYFIDKSPVERAYWNPGEPNNTKEGDDCLEIFFFYHSACLHHHVFRQLQRFEILTLCSVTFRKS